MRKTSMFIKSRALYLSLILTCAAFLSCDRIMPVKNADMFADVPEISGINSGSFNTVQSFSVTGESRASIEYSLDGGSSWLDYSGNVTLNTDGTYTVIARQTDRAGNESEESDPYTLILDVTPPDNVTSPAGSGSDETITLSWTEPTGDATYDGVTISFTPAAGGVTQPVSVAAGTTSIDITPLTNETAYTFTIVSSDTMGNTSSGTSLTYTIEIVEDPVIDPAPPADKYFSEQTITITSATPGATIYYTLDGSDPSDTNGTAISSGDTFTLSSTCTVKAIAHAADMVPSSIVTTDYAFQEWTWVSGSDTITQSGVYGTTTVPDAANIPGSRTYFGSCIDSADAIWIFGGNGYDTSGTAGTLNDLWKYEPATGEWAWMSGSDTITQTGVYGTQGTADTANVPGSRNYGSLASDSNDILWLFGGSGYDSSGTSGRLNDLWKYNPGTNQWTWISGSDTCNQAGTYGTQGTAEASSVPGARYGSAICIDSSDIIWLFGGYGYDGSGDIGFLNDLWKFDGSQWTWVSGSDTRSQEGTYNTQGTAEATSAPGSRQMAGVSIDSSDNIWVFGGSGLDSTTTSGQLNDLWKFDPDTGFWTWISGSDTCGQKGTHGTQGTGDTGNIPGGRSYLSISIDSSDNVWLFGGSGLDGEGESGRLNDLWKYEPGTEEWTWVSGFEKYNQPGTYGTQGSGEVNNVAGSRYSYGSLMIDSSDNLWIFGGSGYDGSGSIGYSNDLWIFEP